MYQRNISHMANLAIGTAAEVVRHTPTIWSGIRSGYASVRKGINNIKSALAGTAVEDVKGQILQLAEELDAVVDSLEETTDRIEQLEQELERERDAAVYNREVFEAVWHWSQQSWFKRAFTRPNLPPQKLWRDGKPVKSGS